MGTFAPLLADSLEGFYKDFLSFLVNKGFQDSGHTPEGIKGKKGIKVERARAAQKGMTTFRTLIPFIPALCVLGVLASIRLALAFDVPCEEGPRVQGPFRGLLKMMGPSYDLVHGAERSRAFASFEIFLRGLCG